MAETNGSNQLKLKSINQSEIRKIIYHFGPISRQEIASKLSLTLPTITTTVAKLISLGLVREVSTADRGSNAPGRKTQLIDVVEESRLFLGVEMRSNLRRIAITTYRGRILACISDEAEYTDYQQLLGVTCNLTKKLLRSARLSREKIAGIGIGVPGVVDGEAGILLGFPEQRWGKKNVCRDFRELMKYSGPIWLENNSCARAYGTYLFHKEHLEQSDYFTRLLVAVGIACPLMDTHIQVPRPVIGMGEIGHMVIEPGGRLCRCGNRGCLEAYSSERAILERCWEVMDQGRAPNLSRRVQENGRMTMNQVLASREDAAVQDVLDDAIDKLGIAVANVQNFVGSQRILVECQYFDDEKSKARLLDVVDRNLYKKWPTVSEVVFLPQNDYYGATGAAAVAVYKDLQTYVE